SSAPASLSAPGSGPPSAGARAASDPPGLAAPPAPAAPPPGAPSPSPSRAPRHAPRVSLPFDEGPHPVYAPQTLDLLARHGARATFFPIGRDVLAHPDLVRRAAALGHGIGSPPLTHSTDLL